MLLGLVGISTALAATPLFATADWGVLAVAPTPTGPLSEGDLAAVVQPMAPALAACFRADGLSPAGVTFRIGDAGEPIGTSVDSGAPDVQACLAGVVAPLRFAAAAAGSHVSLVLVPFEPPVLADGERAAPSPSAGASIGLEDLLGRKGTSSPKAGGTVGLGGDPMVLGELDRAQVDDVVRANHGALETCYANALAATPTLAGKITTKFVIGSTGTVTSSVTKSTTIDDPALYRCVAEAFAGLTFPAPKGGGIVIVSYPLIFTP